MPKQRPRTYITRTVLKHPADLVRRWHSSITSVLRAFSILDFHLCKIEKIDINHHRVKMRVHSGAKKDLVVYRIYYPPTGAFLKVREERGYFAYFEHQVEINDLESGDTEVIDRIDFSLPCPFWRLETRQIQFEKGFKKHFRYKYDILRKDLELYERTMDINQKKILITGSKGLIGSSFSNFLEIMGHDVWHLVRSKDDLIHEKSILFNWQTGEANRPALEGFDYVYHLQGKSLTKRWTKKRKQELLASRYESTKALADLLSGLTNPPKGFFCASAIGYYGETGNKTVSEKDVVQADTFLAEICRSWEEATKSLESRGVRVVHLRFGIVLSPCGGALKQMLSVFKLGLGGVLGSGRQYMSWIAMDDVLGAMYHVLIEKSIVGSINLVSPNPVTNREFTKTLARSLGKSVGPPIPGFILVLLKGQMAKELLLTSTRVCPKLLQETGYYFRYPHLKDAFAHLF